MAIVLPAGGFVVYTLLSRSSRQSPQSWWYTWWYTPCPSSSDIIDQYIGSHRQVITDLVNDNDKEKKTDDVTPCVTSDCDDSQLQSQALLEAELKELREKYQKEVDERLSLALKFENMFLDLGKARDEIKKHLLELERKEKVIQRHQRQRKLLNKEMRSLKESVKTLTGQVQVLENDLKASPNTEKAARVVLE